MSGAPCHAEEEQWRQGEGQGAHGEALSLLIRGEANAGVIAGVEKSLRGEKAKRELLFMQKLDAVAQVEAQALLGKKRVDGGLPKATSKDGTINVGDR